MPLVTSLAMSSKAIPDSFEQNDGSVMLSSITEEELKQKQRSDPAICEVISQLETGEIPPPAVRRELPELPVLMRDKQT